MKKIAFALLCGLASTAHADVAITDNNAKVTVDCAKDGSVSSVANHATITLKGTCAKVLIDGNHNTVYGAVTELSVNGNHNTATVTADNVAINGNSNTVVVTRALKRKAPLVSDLGTGNTVRSK